MSTSSSIHRGLATALALCGLQAAQAETTIGLTQNWTLVSFDSATPSFGSPSGSERLQRNAGVAWRAGSTSRLG